MSKSEFKRQTILRGGKICKKCGGAMNDGKAIENTAVGIGDFGEDDIVTVSYGGTGKVIDVLKCTECGWSYSK